MLADNSSKPVSILLVEDNEDDVLLTMRALRKQVLESDEIVVTRDGDRALDFLFARGEYEERNGAIMPRLILLDINLPRVDGLQVLRQVRSDPRTRIVPVVMLTSSAAEQDLHSSYRAGANGYIQKPVDSQEFEAIVEQVVTYWIGLNRSPGNYGGAPRWAHLSRPRS